MEDKIHDSTITEYIKNVRNQMNKISTAYEESDTPLNQFLQAKYERPNYSPYSNNSFSNLYENSFTNEDYREDLYNTKPKAQNKRESKNIEPQAKVFELESRVAELLKIQDNLMKNLEENKRKALQAEQYDRKMILELKEKLTFANTKNLNLEEALHSSGKEKMRKYIKELEICRETLKTENTNLILKMQEINKDLEMIEIQSKSMSDELQSLKQQNSSLQSELLSQKSEKVSLLKQIDITTEELSSKENIIQDLTLRLEDLKSLIQSTSLQKFSNYSSYSVNTQLETLAKENETLKSLVSQKPTNSDILSAKKKIDKLEKVVDSLNNSANNDRSKSCEKKNIASLASQNRILRELKNELGANSPFDLLQSVKNVNRKNKVLVKSQEFVEKLKKFLTETGVEDFVTMKKMWKWLKGLLNEYFLLKKHAEISESSVKVFDKIKAMLNVEAEDATGVLSKVLIENEFLKLVIGKAKVVLRVNRKISLQEFEKELDSRL